MARGSELSAVVRESGDLEVPVNYLIMIYANPAGWAKPTDARRMDFRRAHGVPHDDLVASKERVR